MILLLLFQEYVWERMKRQLFTSQGAVVVILLLTRMSCIFFSIQKACFLHPFCDCLLRSKDLCCQWRQIILYILFNFFSDKVNFWHLLWQWNSFNISISSCTLPFDLSNHVSFWQAFFFLKWWLIYFLIALFSKIVRKKHLLILILKPTFKLFIHFFYFCICRTLCRMQGFSLLFQQQYIHLAHIGTTNKCDRGNFSKQLSTTKCAK